MSGSIEVNWAVSVVTVALGAFVWTSPAQAARIWGPERFDSLTPVQRTRIIRWFRVLGILLWLAGLLFAVDSLWYSHYHRWGAARRGPSIVFVVQVRVDCDIFGSQPSSR